MIMKLFIALEEASVPVTLGIGYDPEDNPQSAFVEVQEASSEVDTLSAGIVEAQDTVDTITEIACNLSETLEEGGLTPPVAKMITAAVEHFTARLGSSKKMIPALECFGGTMSRKRGTELALEGIVQFGKDVIAMIRAAFKKIFEFFKNLFDKIFSAKDKNKKQVEKVEKAVDDLEKKVGNVSTAEAAVEKAVKEKAAEKPAQTTAHKPAEKAAEKANVFSQPINSADDLDEFMGKGKAPEKKHEPTAQKHQEKSTLPEHLIHQNHLAINNPRLANYFGGAFAFNQAADKFKRIHEGISDFVNDVTSIMSTAQSSYHKRKPGDAAIDFEKDVTDRYLGLLKEFDKEPDGDGVVKVTMFPYGGRIKWSRPSEGSSKLEVTFENYVDYENTNDLIQVCPLKEMTQITRLLKGASDYARLDKYIRISKEDNDSFCTKIERRTDENYRSLSDHHDTMIDNMGEDDKAAEAKARSEQAIVDLKAFRSLFETTMKILSVVAKFETQSHIVFTEWCALSVQEIKRLYPGTVDLT